MQKEFLDEAIKLMKIERKKFPSKFNVPFKTFEKWFYEEYNIPKEFYNDILSLFPNLGEFNKYVINEVDDNWGRKKGGYNRISKIKNKPKYFAELQRNRRNTAAKVLHIENVRVKTPFSKMILKNKLKPLPFLIVLLLTDGYVYKNKKCFEVGFASKNKELIKIFQELVKMWKREIIVSQYNRKDDIMINYFHLPLNNDLVRVVPSFKKSPIKIRKEEYLKEPQPNLNFLKRRSYEYKILSARLAFSTEGAICLGYKKLKRGIILQPSLFFSCANPQLCSDWENIFSSIGLEFNIVNDSNKWSGIAGLYSRKRENLIKFEKINGFVEGVKVTGKSRYFNGVEKNKVLEFCLQNRKFENKESLIKKIENMGL